MPASAEVFPAWAKRPEDVLAHYNVEPTKGLSEEEVQKRREEWGWNELDHEPATPLWKLVLQQFDDTLVKVCARMLLHAGVWERERGALRCVRALADRCAEGGCRPPVIAAWQRDAAHVLREGMLFVLLG